jgi:hypothetical protein
VLSINAKTFIFLEKSLGKVLVFRKKAVPLHPLSLKNVWRSKIGKSSLKRLHKTDTKVVQEAK